MNYYLFNITNPDDVILKGAKPILNQTGVIVYKYVINEKTNISISLSRQKLKFCLGKLQQRKFVIYFWELHETFFN